jgi:flagellar biosynthesis GTPase FlhF
MSAHDHVPRFTFVNDVRPYFRPILAVIAIIYFSSLSYMAFRGILAPFFGINVVSKEYRKIETATILAPLKYPAQRTQGPVPRPELTPEQISERESRRREREEREREERERAERERAEREKAEKEAAELAAKEAEKEEEKTPEPTKFGEINDAPIKDIVGKVYALYQAGGLDLKGEDLEFSVMAAFAIDKDGSIPKKSIKILKSSGSKIIDEKAIEILWNIGESHALGPISMLTSNSIRLDLNDRVARLTITGFAPSSDVAKAKAQELNFLFFAMKMTQKDSDTAELLSGVKIRSDNNRVDAELTVSRARAGAMMRARFGNNQ